MAVSTMYKLKKSKKYSTYEMWLLQIFWIAISTDVWKKIVFIYVYARYHSNEMLSISLHLSRRVAFVHFFINPPNIP